MCKNMKKEILSIILFIFTNSASACSCVNSSVDKLYSMATTIFSAYIIQAELKSGSGGLYNASDTHVEGEYQITRVFKGNPNKNGSVLIADLQSGNCSVGLTIGMEYIFFLDNNSGTSYCRGTRKLGFNPKKDSILFDNLKSLKINEK